MSTKTFPCLFCEKPMKSHQQAIDCDSCGRWQHRGLRGCGNTAKIGADIYTYIFGMVCDLQDVAIKSVLGEERVIGHINMTGQEGGKTKEWAIVELQGSLETRHPVPLSGRHIGDLHFTHKDEPVLIIGHHILYGKVVTLEKPYGVLVKDEGDSSTHKDVGINYSVVAVVKKKLLFKTRPKPIIANVPKKL